MLRSSSSTTAGDMQSVLMAENPTSKKVKIAHDGSSGEQEEDFVTNTALRQSVFHNSATGFGRRSAQGSDKGKLNNPTQFRKNPSTLAYLNSNVEERFVVFLYEDRLSIILTWIAACLCAIPVATVSLIRNATSSTVGFSTLVGPCILFVCVSLACIALSVHQSRVLRSIDRVASRMAPESQKWLLASTSAFHSLYLNCWAQEIVIIVGLIAGLWFCSYTYAARSVTCYENCQYFTDLDAIIFLFLPILINLSPIRFKHVVPLLIFTNLMYFGVRYVPGSPTIYYPLYTSFYLVHLACCVLVMVAVHNNEERYRTEFEKVSLMHLECKMMAETREHVARLVGYMIPSDVARRITSGQSVTETSYGAVAVFCISNYSLYSCSSGGAEIVERLQFVHLVLDNVKLKFEAVMRFHSMGDRYVVACGPFATDILGASTEETKESTMGTQREQSLGSGHNEQSSSSTSAKHSRKGDAEGKAPLIGPDDNGTPHATASYSLQRRVADIVFEFIKCAASQLLEQTQSAASLLLNQNQTPNPLAWATLSGDGDGAAEEMETPLAATRSPGSIESLRLLCAADVGQLTAVLSGRYSDYALVGTPVDNCDVVLRGVDEYPRRGETEPSSHMQCGTTTLFLSEAFGRAVFDRMVPGKSTDSAAGDGPEYDLERAPLRYEASNHNRHDRTRKSSIARRDATTGQQFHLFDVDCVPPHHVLGADAMMPASLVSENPLSAISERNSQSASFGIRRKGGRLGWYMSHVDVPLVSSAQRSKLFAPTQNDELIVEAVQRVNRAVHLVARMALDYRFEQSETEDGYAAFLVEENNKARHTEMMFICCAIMSLVLLTVHLVYRWGADLPGPGYIFFVVAFGVDCGGLLLRLIRKNAVPHPVFVALFVAQCALWFGAFYMDPLGSIIHNDQMIWACVVSLLFLTVEPQYVLWPQVLLDALILVPFIPLIVKIPFVDLKAKAYLVMGLLIVQTLTFMTRILSDRSSRRQFANRVQRTMFSEELEKDYAVMEELLGSVVPHRLADRLMSNVRGVRHRQQHQDTELNDQFADEDEGQLAFAVKRIVPHADSLYTTRTLDMPVALIRLRPRETWDARKTPKGSVRRSSASGMMPAAPDREVAVVGLPSFAYALPVPPVSFVVLSLWERITELLSAREDIIRVKFTGDECLLAADESNFNAKFLSLFEACRLVHQLVSMSPDRDAVSLKMAMTSGPLMGAVLGTVALSFEYFGESLTTASHILDDMTHDGTLVTERFVSQCALSWSIGRATIVNGLVDMTVGDMLQSFGREHATFSEVPHLWRIRGRGTPIEVRLVSFNLPMVEAFPSLRM